MRSCGLIALFFLVSSCYGQAPLPSDPIACSYARLPERLPFASLDTTRLIAAGETEPNNSVAQAQPIPLGFAADEQRDVDMTGSITPFDIDFFKFEAKKGQILGVAILAVDADELDSRVSIHDSTGATLVLNEDHQIGITKIADLYPPESELPAGGLRQDSILSFALPEDGTYHIRVDGHGASSGKYLAQLRLRNPPIAMEKVWYEANPVSRF